jgi:hypothetical protein
MMRCFTMTRNEVQVTETLMTSSRRAELAQNSVGLDQLWEKIQELLLKLKDQITRLILWPFLKP